MARSAGRRSRRKATSVPSGETSPASAAEKRRRSAPPTSGTRQRDGPVLPSVRVKRSDCPSGKNLGKESPGPAVTALSPSPRTCLSQIRDRPPRREANATRLPSGEAAGWESTPECVSVRRAGGGVAAGPRNANAPANPAAAPAATRRAGPTTRRRPPRPRRRTVAPARPGSDGREATSSDSSANARSRADWKRALRCFSRHRPTIRSSWRGIPCRSVVRSGGSDRRIAAIVSTADPAPKARRPESIS